MQKPAAEQFHPDAQQHVNHTGSGQTAEGRGDAPGLDPVNNRGDEGERRGQKYRDHPLGQELKNQCAGAGGEKGDAGVQTGEKGHQYQSAESDKKHLGADDGNFEGETVFDG